MIIVQPFTRSLSFIRKNSISFLNIIPGTMASSSSSSSSWQSRTKVTGVIFDMDGTLTEEHAIDFKAMYNRIGIKKRGDDIITQVKEDLHEEEHQRAFDIIVDEEMLGCERMKVKEDLHDCISFLTERDIKMAISTRNCREAYETFAEKANFPPETFEPVLDRNSLSGVNKPDPQVAHHILGEWGGVLPHEVWFVGDSIDDIRCGKGAGCNTCLITASNKKHDDEHLIDHRVTTLKEFMDILNEYEKST